MLIPTRVSFFEMSCEILHFIMTCKYNRTFYFMLYVICKVLETKGIRYEIAKKAMFVLSLGPFMFTQ
jgi:hypothetical protein